MAEEMWRLSAATSSCELLGGLVRAEEMCWEVSGFYMFSSGAVWALGPRLSMTMRVQKLALGVNLRTREVSQWEIRKNSDGEV